MCDQPPSAEPSPTKTTSDELESAASLDLRSLYQRIATRQKSQPSNSHTTRLLHGSQETRLRKIAEEHCELLLAASSQEPPERLIHELADLIFHLLIFMVAENLPLEALEAEWGARTYPGKPARRASSLSRTSV